MLTSDKQDLEAEIHAINSFDPQPKKQAALSANESNTRDTRRVDWISIPDGDSSNKGSCLTNGNKVSDYQQGDGDCQSACDATLDNIKAAKAVETVVVNTGSITELSTVETISIANPSKQFEKKTITTRHLKSWFFMKKGWVELMHST